MEQGESDQCGSLQVQGGNQSLEMHPHTPSLLNLGASILHPPSACTQAGRTLPIQPSPSTERDFLGHVPMQAAMLPKGKLRQGGWCTRGAALCNWQQILGIRQCPGALSQLWSHNKHPALSMSRGPWGHFGVFFYFLSSRERGWTCPGCVCWQPRKPPVPWADPPAQAAEEEVGFCSSALLR